MNQSPYGNLGFQASGPSFGGAGGGLLKGFLMNLMMKGKPQPPTGAQMGALDAGMGPVNAPTGAAMMAAPSPQAYGQAATQPGINSISQNPYYMTGFMGSGLN